MELSTIIQAIDAEIAKLQGVKNLLSGNSSAPGKRKPGRPAKGAPSSFGGNAPTVAAPIKRKTHTMSPEARARIGAAQKARWARVRKSQKFA
jgi:hypothetical protein